jgi:hypothetical protein
LIVFSSRQQASKKERKKERKSQQRRSREEKPNQKPLPKKRERNPTRELDPSSLQTGNCLVQEKKIQKKNSQTFPPNYVLYFFLLLCVALYFVAIRFLWLLQNCNLGSHSTPIRRHRNSITSSTRESYQAHVCVSIDPHAHSRREISVATAAVVVAAGFLGYLQAIPSHRRCHRCALARK